MIPLLAAAAAPLIKELMQNGLSMLASAVANKGKEVVEEKLGITLSTGMSEEKIMALRQAEMDHEEELMRLALEGRKIDADLEKAGGKEVTARWQADMLSDSWLSKNIRPMVLLLLLTTYFLFSVASAFELHVTQAYVELLAQMLMLVMAAYFVGRSAEKIIDMKERGK